MLPEPEPVPAVIDMPPARPPRASVVVPFHGQLEYARLCLPRLLRLSRSAREVVCIDFDGLDGTAEYLAGLAEFTPVPLRRLRVDSDLPFGRAVREALASLETDLVAFASTDTLVADMWLEQLSALLTMSPALGLVGAASSLNVANQYSGPVPYRKALDERLAGLVTAGPDERREGLAEVDEFARWWRGEHRGKWSEEGHVGGYCLMARRRALEDADLDDLPDALGWFDTEALCQRLRKANWRTAACRDLFAHTFGVRHYVKPTPQAP